MGSVVGPGKYIQFTLLNDCDPGIASGRKRGADRTLEVGGM